MDKLDLVTVEMLFQLGTGSKNLVEFLLALAWYTKHVHQNPMKVHAKEDPKILLAKQLINVEHVTHLPLMEGNVSLLINTLM